MSKHPEVKRLANQALRMFNRHYGRRFRLIHKGQLGEGQPMLNQFREVIFMSPEHVKQSVAWLVKDVKMRKPKAFGVLLDDVADAHTAISQRYGTSIRLCRIYDVAHGSRYIVTAFFAA